MHRMSWITMWRVATMLAWFILYKGGLLPPFNMIQIFRFFIWYQNYNQPFVSAKASPIISSITSTININISTSYPLQFKLLYNHSFLVSTININISTISNFFYNYHDGILKARQASSSSTSRVFSKHF